jgi:PII-like signaling protein
MDLLNKAKLFGNYSLAFGKTHKVLIKASEYLPKDFAALIHVLTKDEKNLQVRETLSQDYVLNSFYKPLSQKLEKAEFDTWKISMKAAVISRTVNHWLGHSNYAESFIAALIRDLPIMILRMEDPENYKNFEQKVMEGQSITQASLMCFGIGLEQYIEQFSKHFKYSFVDAEQERIIDFSYYLAESFSNKNEKASSLWIRSQDEMDKLGLKMKEDEWANKISILFVKTLEVESKFK